MPPSLVKSSELTVSQADLPPVDSIKPENFAPSGDTKFEVTDATEQGHVKDRLKVGAGEIAKSVHEASKGLYEEHTINILDIDGNATPETITVHELLSYQPKRFIEYTPGNPTVRTAEAATYVREVYGKDVAGNTLVDNVKTYIDSLPQTALENCVWEFIDTQTLSNAQVKEILKETLILTIASLPVQDAHKFLKDFTTGKLTLTEVTTSTSPYGGGAATQRRPSLCAPHFLEALAVTTYSRGNTDANLSDELKNALAIADQTGFVTTTELYSNNAFNEVDFATPFVEINEWVDDGQTMLKGINHLIEETIKDETIQELVKSKFDVQNSFGTAPHTVEDSLNNMELLLSSLKKVKDDVSSDEKTALRKATDSLKDAAVRYGLETFDPEILSTVEANLNPTDVRRVQAVGVRAYHELFPMAGGSLTLTDALPWDSTKTWADVKTSLEDAIVNPTSGVRVQDAISTLEKIALFGPAGTKDQAKNLMLEMIAQQLMTYPEGVELIDKLDGKDLSEYGNLIYEFLTDTTGLGGDRNNSFVKASEYWLSVIKNFEGFNEIITANTTGGTPTPEQQVQYANLMSYMQMEDANILTYAMEGALEKVQELQKDEIARALGLDPDDPTVQKILDQRDPTKAMESETVKMKSIFEKLKGKAFAVATALALTTVAMGTGGGLIAAGVYALVGIAALGNAKSKAGGWKNLGKGVLDSFKGAMGYLFSKDHTAKEKWIYAGTAVFGGMARYLWPGGGAVVSGLIELGAAGAFEVSLGKKQAELVKAMNEAYQYVEDNQDVSITPTGGAAINVKFAPYLKMAVRHLDDIKKNSGSSYDETVQMDAMIAAGGELEKAGLVFKHFKEKRDALELSSKYDAVNNTLGAYNAMLAGVIAGNVLALGTRLVGAIDAQGAEFRENVVQPATERIEEKFDNLGDRISRSARAFGEEWRSGSSSTGTGSEATTEIDSATRSYTAMGEQAQAHADWQAQLDGEEVFRNPTGGADVAEFDVTARGTLNLPGSAWNGTTLGALPGNGSMPSDPSLFYGGSHGMAATYFQQGAVAAGGPDYIDKLFDGDVTQAHRVLNKLESVYNTEYRGGGHSTLEYTFKDAYLEETGIKLP